MSVLTGIAPQTLLALDGEWFAALDEALEERWSHATELAAQQVELLHALLLTYLRQHSKRGTRLPAPLVVPRPGRGASADAAPAVERPPRISIVELAALTRTRIEVPGG